MDYIARGQNGSLITSGAVADKLLACNFDTRCLRPWIGRDGRAYISTIGNDGKPKATLVQNTTATLRKDDWKLLDDAIIKVSKPRLKAVGDLRSAGLTFTIPNGMAKTVLETETVSDIGPASVSMDGTRENEDDRPVFELGNLPLPIIHKDFHFSSRQIAVSRNGGSPLDTTSAELAARRVAEEAEKLLLGNSTVADQYAFGGGVIYGYSDFPNKITGVLSLPTDSGWNGERFLGEVLTMKQQSQAAYHYGPWILYVAPNWDRYLDDDFKAASDKSIRSRVKEVDGLQDIKTLDYLTDYDVILVQQTSDVVRMVIGMDITTVEWDTIGGLRKNFKIMAILVPQLRADQLGNSGIVYAVAA